MFEVQAYCLLKVFAFTILINQVLGSNTSMEDGQPLGQRNACDTVCPGDTLIYNCSVVVNSPPGGFTIWTGTAFDCLSNEIILHHSMFTTTTAGVCNNGAIVGRNFGVEGNNYISQLTVNITSEMRGKTIECIHDNETEEAVVLQRTIPFSDPLPPENLHLSRADFISRKLIFNWSPVAENCRDSRYHIISSNCGSCPTTTTNTTVTCTDVPTNSSTCTFAVQTEVCGTYGNISDPLSTVVVDTDGSQQNASLSILIIGLVLFFIAIVLIVGCIAYGLLRRSTINLPCYKVTVEAGTPQTLNTVDQSIRNPACEDKVTPTRNPHRNGTGVYHSGVGPSWQEVPNSQRNTESYMYTDDTQVYSALNKHGDKDDSCVDNPPAKPPRRRSSVNKPGSMSVTVDYHIYDRTSHF